MKWNFVELSREEILALDRPANGSGGFQTFIKRLQSQVNHGTGTISGAFTLSGPRTEEARASVTRVNGAMAHRGPDGDGFFHAPRVELGHRRLAIIDRAGGHQPMAHEDGFCRITVNGEIYNHKAIRPLLEAKGHQFRRASRLDSRSGGLLYDSRAARGNAAAIPCEAG